MQTERCLDIHHIVFVSRANNFIMLGPFFTETVPSLPVHSVKPQESYISRYFFVAYGDATSFAGSYILIGMKTEDLDVSETADTFSFVFRADGMRSIFYDAEVIFFCHGI